MVVWPSSTGSLSSASLYSRRFTAVLGDSLGFSGVLAQWVWMGWVVDYGKYEQALGFHFMGSTCYFRGELWTLPFANNFSFYYLQYLWFWFRSSAWDGEFKVHFKATWSFKLKPPRQTMLPDAAAEQQTEQAFWRILNQDSRCSRPTFLFLFNWKGTIFFIPKMKKDKVCFL